MKDANYEKIKSIDKNEVIVSVKGLKKSFGANLALNGTSIEVRCGEIFGILGPDGAGKTTLMRIMAGLMDFDSGEAKVLGYDLTKGSGGLCDHIAYMPQRFGLYEDLTVLENIHFYSDLYNMPRGPQLDARIEELLTFCRMDRFKNRYAGKLSGGMKQKLALTCALIHTPKLLLLDEPTNGVDPVSRREFWKILYDMLATGVTIFVSTTYLDEAERCNKIAFLNKGVITAVDSPQNLKMNSPNTMWKLEAGDKFAVTEALKSCDFIKSVYMMGPTVHLFIPASIERGAVEKKLSERLAIAGLKLETLEAITPSLEDIFIEQTGEGEK